MDSGVFRAGTQANRAFSFPRAGKTQLGRGPQTKFCTAQRVVFFLVGASENRRYFGGNRGCDSNKPLSVLPFGPPGTIFASNQSWRLGGQLPFPGAAGEGLAFEEFHTRRQSGTPCPGGPGTRHVSKRAFRRFHGSAGSPPDSDLLVTRRSRGSGQVIETAPRTAPLTRLSG